MLRAAPLTAAVLLAACAAPRRTTSTPPLRTAPQARPSSAPRGEQVAVVCRMERPTGSNIAKRVCWRTDDLERARAQAQRVLLTQPLPPGDPAALQAASRPGGP